MTFFSKKHKSIDKTDNRVLQITKFNYIISHILFCILSIGKIY